MAGTRICYFGTYEADYPGNRVLIEGLRRSGVEVVECHEPLWEKSRTKDRRYFGLRSVLGLSVRYAWTCIRLATRAVRLGPIDAVIVGFNGHADLLMARFVANAYQVPLVFNPMLSIYDTLVIDRAYFAQRSLAARLLLTIERTLCRLPDCVLMDAREHFVLFHELLGVPWAKYRQLYFGADDRQFRREKYDHGKRVFRVLFYGKFQPLQGVEYIIKAAALLRDYRDVRFRVIGTGPDYPRVRTLAEQERLENVDFVDWVDFGRLPSEIAEADVCLGVFGTTGKVRRSIANKVIQALAVGRPVITARSPASEQLLTDEAEVLFCPPGDPAALAEAILRLRGDQALCDRLAEGGYLRYLRCCSPEAVGARAVEYLQGLARRTQVLADASRPQ